MLFDPENPIVKLCAEGMDAEGRGEMTLSKQLFQEAWDKATNDAEKFTAAHYLARRQDSPEEKLHWDIIAFEFAEKVEDETIRGSYPSLYLNIAKGYEDLGQINTAKDYYLKAKEACVALPDTPYARMIRSGIDAALKRLA